MKCSVNSCFQLVLHLEEQKNDRPFCYMHVKCRDGIISNPQDYTIANNETVLRIPLSLPCWFHKVSEKPWDM